MSVVVTIKKDGIIYMGADSQASCGGTRSTFSNPNNYKIWAMSDIDNCLMGSVGTLRANNIIKVASNLIPEIVDLKDNVDFRFVVRHFVPRLMDELDEYKVLCKGKDDVLDMAASFLLAYHDRLYSIEHYGSVIEIDDFCAIGSGSCESLGRLLSSANIDDPVERIKMAIKASVAHDICVDYPIVISNTKDTEYKVYYEKDL